MVKFFDKNLQYFFNFIHKVFIIISSSIISFTQFSIIVRLKKQKNNNFCFYLKV